MVTLNRQQVKELGQAVLRGFTKQAEEIFFVGMKECCAFGAKRTESKDFPGAKLYRFERGPWTLVDQYVEGIDGYSANWTMISHAGVPFWQMHSAGWDKDDVATSIVKDVLSATYAKKEFFGGRGPRLKVMDYDRTYDNVLDGNSSFWGFRGREELYTKSFPEGCDNGLAELDKHQLSYRSYQGGLLVSPY